MVGEVLAGESREAGFGGQVGAGQIGAVETKGLVHGIVLELMVEEPGTGGVEGGHWVEGDSGGADASGK